MHLSAPELMQPVYHFLDGLIRDYGDLLFVVLVNAAVPLIGWILSGGLRRKQSAQEHTSIIVIYAPTRPPPVPPPIIGREPHSSSGDDGDSFAA